MTALVEFKQVHRSFELRNPAKLFGGKRALHAVQDVSFEIAPGQTLGLVGESGCGKSTVGKLVLGLLAPTGGEVRFDGAALCANPKDPAWRAQRRDMQMIFQNPFGALNPRLSIGRQMREVLDTHDIGAADERAEEVAALMRAVGLAPQMQDRYPHQMSGGQLQRVVIARALAVSPRFLVCDEAVAALDVSIQAQVVNLLQDIQEERNLTYLFISHDLEIIRHISDRIVVMYLGRVVEVGTAQAVFEASRHPYTRALIAAAPNPVPGARKDEPLLEGDPPSPLDPPSGCVFRTRCRHAQPACGERIPDLASVGGDHAVACIRSHEI
ncbi:MAG: ABC transporter ATP-binding protein [Pseudomonadota bacterium]